MLQMFFELSKLWQGVVIGCVASIVTLWWYKRRSVLPAGPRGLPLLGQVLDIDKETIETFTSWANFFGSYMTVYYGRVPTVVLNTRKGVEETLIKQQDVFAGRPKSWSADQLTNGQKGIILSDYSPTLKQQRRVVHMALRSYSFLSGFHLESKVNKSVMKVVELLRAEKTPVDPRSFMEQITLNILCGVCFDEIYDLQSKKFQKLLGQQNEVRKLSEKSYFLEDYVPPLKWFKASKVNKLVKCINKMKDFFEKQVECHKDTFETENVRDVTDAILLSQLEDEVEEVELSQRLTDEHVTCMLMDIFKAGYDPIHLTLTWTLMHLATNQDVQKKVHKELDSILESKSTVTLTDRANMSYLQAVINESMRISTVIPLGTPHTASEDAFIENYFVMKGTNVMVNHWFLNHDPDVWEEPDVFKPERFLTEEGKVKAKSDLFIPFSTGRRSCLGESLAKPELHLILAGLLKHFTVTVPSDETIDTEPLYMSSLSVPKPFKIIFTPRK